MKRSRAEEHALVHKHQTTYNYDARKFHAAALAEAQALTAPGRPVQRPRATKTALRSAGGSVWRDDTLDTWPEGDFRLFVGNIGNEVTDELLVHSFGRYPSLVKGKVIRNKHTNKSKGFAFVSFMDPFDCAKALREMNGKYIGNRPCKITKSNWQDRSLKEVQKKDKKKAKLHKSWGITD